jgi:Uma2 family endonuclease
MATVTEPELELDLTPPPYPVKRFTVDEYHRMIDAGVFADDERFELLEGWIIPKRRQGPPVAVALGLIDRRLIAALPDGWSYRPRGAITLVGSEPEPGASVVRGQPRDYLAHHPYASDVALVVEAADEAIDLVRGLKGRVYARAAIPEYWIVNVSEGWVEVESDPTGPAEAPAYRSCRIVGPDGEIPLVLDGREVARVAAKDILP